MRSLHPQRNICVFLCLFGLVPALAQKRPHPDFHSDSRLVLVPVIVTNRGGEFVNGLPKEIFAIAEDGIDQQIRSFSEEDAPVSVGIVLDLSGSMKEVLDIGRESFRRFAAQSNPQDEAFLETVSTRPQTWSGFTGDLDELFNKVAFEGAAGSTALLDTIWQSLTQVQSAHHSRKALLILSDGMDNHSRHSREQLLARAVEADVQIYTVMISDPPPNLKALQLAEQQNARALMQDLARKTGGLSFVVGQWRQIRPAVEGIGSALRSQYNIGYVPGNDERTGKWRKIQVRVARSGLKAHARSGYRTD